MERGVYFDAWFPGQHCYHPSLPARRLRMVEHLVDYHATVLVWAALGGGSISLPYLEQEAFGEIDPRFRFYGFLNDAEFIAECRKHGIKVFGIVFEVQGWEFPVELNEAEDRVLALNETRGAGKRDWVECPDREHFCYTMDRNNPIWREYLKAIIRIQIDAAVDGVQLDEAELPLTTLQYGGCFCKDCLKGFRAYLHSLPAEDLPAELRGADLTTFHYGEWLLARGYDFKSNREATPLFTHYLRFQRAAITRYFAELADYARDYAASQGKQVLVSGNFFNLLDQYYALEPKVDLIITEMRNTRYRQPSWYRYVAGFAGPKPVVVVENPYGGVVPEMVADLKTGKGYDRFRMSLYEAAALGANMSVPYGAWLGSIEQDAFYPPHELCVEIQNFLAGNESLFSRQTCNDVAVVYSIESEFQRAARRDQVANDPLNLASGGTIPFWTVSDALCDATQPYDVLFFPEGELRKDALSQSDLAQYRTVILPDCVVLTAEQARLLHEVLAAGTRLLVMGELGSNLPLEVLGPILDHPGTRRVPISPTIAIEDLLEEHQIRVTPGGDLMINVQRVDGGAAVHLIRYDFDLEQDRTPPLPELTIELRLPEQFNRLSVHSPCIGMTGALGR